MLVCCLDLVCLFNCGYLLLIVWLFGYLVWRGFILLYFRRLVDCVVVHALVWLLLCLFDYGYFIVYGFGVWPVGGGWFVMFCAKGACLIML